MNKRMHNTNLTMRYTLFLIIFFTCFASQAFARLYYNTYICATNNSQANFVEMFVYGGSRKPKRIVLTKDEAPLLSDGYKSDHTYTPVEASPNEGLRLIPTTPQSLKSRLKIRIQKKGSMSEVLFNGDVENYQLEPDTSGCFGLCLKAKSVFICPGTTTGRWVEVESGKESNRAIKKQCKEMGCTAPTT